MAAQNGDSTTALCRHDHTTTVLALIILKRHDAHLRPIVVVQEQFGPVAFVQVISGQIKSHAFLLIGTLGA